MILALDQLQFQGVVPVRGLLGQRETGVQGHDVVEVVACAAILAVCVVQQPFEAQGAVGGGGQRHAACEVKTIEARLLVGIPQRDERIIAARHARAVQALGIDVVGHQRIMGRGPEGPIAPSRVPIIGGAQCMGTLRLEVRVAHVAVAIAGKVVHDSRHGVGGPRIALIEIGRAGRDAIAQQQAAVLGHLIAQQRAQVFVVVAAGPPMGIERRRIGPVHHVVVAMDGPCVHQHAFPAPAQQGGPLGIEMPLPFGEQGTAVAAPVVDVPERSGRHAAHGHPWG